MNAQLAERLGLPLTTLEKLQSVLALHPTIEQAVVYGSRAKRSYRNGSDIDLTLKSESLNFAELMQIEDQIDDLLLPYTVDLSHYQNLTNPDLLEHIEQVGVVIYQQQASLTCVADGV
jgi:uncharacterized protein